MVRRFRPRKTKKMAKILHTWILVMLAHQNLPRPWRMDDRLDSVSAITGRTGEDYQPYSTENHTPPLSVRLPSGCNSNILNGSPSTTQSSNRCRMMTLSSTIPLLVETFLGQETLRLVLGLNRLRSDGSDNHTLSSTLFEDADLNLYYTWDTGESETATSVGLGVGAVDSTDNYSGYLTWHLRRLLTSRLP